MRAVRPGFSACLPALDARAQPGDLDGAVAAGRAVADFVEQTARKFAPVGRGVPGQNTVDLCADQQFDLRRVLAAFDEQVEKVGLAVHCAHDAGAGKFPRGAGAVVQALDPAKRLFLLARLVPVAVGLRRIEVCPHNPQRQTVRAHGKGRVQMQAAAFGAGLVGADNAQSFGLPAPRKVQRTAVLYAQNGGLRAHPLQRALTMRREDVLDRHRARGGLIDEAVMSLDHSALSAGGAGDGAHRIVGHTPCARHQTRAKPRIAQRCATELVRRPTVRVKPVAGRQRRARVDPKARTP